MDQSNPSLYIVGTPIGNLNDISKRAIETLAKMDYVLCEDTRVSKKLLDMIGVNAKLIVYNNYNAQKVIPSVIEDILTHNTKYALISDAGTPLISDPGYKLVNACIDNNISFTIIPGASAVISALVLSGMPSDKFLFCGFAEPKQFQELAQIPSTIIMFESPRRIINTIEQMKQPFYNRKIAVVREITKIFEECIRGTAENIISHFAQNTPKGEMVIVVEPPLSNNAEILNNVTDLVTDLKGKIPDPELSLIISKHFKISKNSVYNLIKTLKN